MDKHQKEKLEILTTFCGYGCPETSSIFFLGIEEHNAWQCNGKDSVDGIVEKLKDVRRELNKEYTYLDSLGGPNGATERMQCNVYIGLTGNPAPEHEIFRHNIHCFNFYPLGAKSQAEYPVQYNECFGFDFNKKSELYEYFDSQTDRKKILRAFINDEILNEDKVLFVLGKSSWKKIEDLFPEVSFKNSFDDWGKKRNEKPSMVKWSDDGKIWLTGHPSYGWINYEVIEKIADIRRDLA